MKRVVCLGLLLLFIITLPGCGSSSDAGKRDEFVKPDFSMVIPVLYQNPLTGVYDRSTPYEERPFAISINNIIAGLPQSGISAADIMVEIETEGGITRLMCLYTQPQRATGGIGSIRSLRHHFVDGVFQWDPIIVHIGTSDYAEQYLRKHGIKTMNGYDSESFLYIDPERRKHYDSEHTKFTDDEHLQNALSNPVYSLSTQWNPAQPVAFNFPARGEEVLLEGGSARQIKYNFSQSYDGDFRFDEDKNEYIKYQHGKPHIDEGNDSEPVSFSNVLLLFAPFSSLQTILVDIDYKTGGEGYYFYKGSYEHFSWNKADYDQPFHFTRDDGSELVINAGKTHIGIVRNSYSNKLSIS